MSHDYKIGIGSDHAGYALKLVIKKHLDNIGFKIIDIGPSSTESTDYPDYAHPLAELITKGKLDIGILICGSGNGIGMTANKHNGIRAALCWNEEIAELARKHNDANIVALPARYIDDREAKNIVSTFIDTAFEEGRHKRRVDKIDKI